MSVLPANTTDPRAVPADARLAHRAVVGSAWLLLAQAMMLPAGVAVLIYLSRTLGPSTYGQYATVMALLIWIEFGLSSILSRSTIKLVSLSNDPHGATAALLRLAALLGVGGGVVMLAAAGPIAALMGDAALTGPIRLAAVDVPLFVVAAIYQSAVTAKGRFRRRAVIAAVRWPMRLALAILLVELGYGLSGALWAVIGASAAELLACALVSPQRFWGAERIASGLHLAETLPLFASALALRAMDGADLLLLRGFGADATVAGRYAVAMNVAVIPGLLSAAVLPTLMAALVHMSRAGREAHARRLCTAVMRAGVWVVPSAAAATVVSTALVRHVFGQAYEGTGPLLMVLLWGGIARLAIAVGGAMLAGLGRSTWAWWAVAPTVPVALLGYITLIPRFGATGAAWATTVAGVVGVLFTIGSLYQRLRLSPPWRSLGLMTPIALLGAGLAAIGPDSGAWPFITVGLTVGMTASAAVVSRDWRWPRDNERAGHGQ